MAGGPALRHPGGRPAGGYTTILDMPNTSPPVKDEATWQLKAGRAQQNSLIDFALWGSAMPSNLDELGRLAELGCVGYKAFTLDAGPDFDWSDEYGQLPGDAGGGGAGRYFWRARRKPPPW